MEILLDLHALVETGKFTPDEAERLKALAAPATASLAINILFGFGAVSVAGGLVGKAPSLYTVIVVALLLGGLSILPAGPRDWSVLGSICLVTGALAIAGGGVALAEGYWAWLLAAAIVLALVAFVAKSGLLAGIWVLALSEGDRGAIRLRSCELNDRTIQADPDDPGLRRRRAWRLSPVAALGGRRSAARHRRVASRTSLLLVNLGFWIGSLWGDRLNFLVGFAERSALPVVPRLVFIVSWAVALVRTAIWAMRGSRPWLVNVCAVFGAIHLYTQWSERLGATPGTVRDARYGARRQVRSAPLVSLCSPLRLGSGASISRRRPKPSPFRLGSVPGLTVVSPTSSNAIGAVAKEGVQ